MTPSSPQPLAWLSVVDLTTVRSGPICTKSPHAHEVLGPLGSDAATLDTRLAEGVIEPYQGETP